MSVRCHRGQQTFGKLPPGVFRNPAYAPKSRYAHGPRLFIDGTDWRTDARFPLVTTRPLAPVISEIFSHCFFKGILHLAPLLSGKALELT